MGGTLAGVRDLQTGGVMRTVNVEWIEVRASVKLVEQPDGSWLVDKIEIDYYEGEIITDKVKEMWEE